MIQLDDLNPQQREAVTHGEGPLLVLAGAGSGKTRAITYRIAHLIAEGTARPRNILAVTFTNKAAGEMRDRVHRLVPAVDGLPTIGTFHSTSLRVLRRYADRLGYTSRFAIYDTADQLALVKRVSRDAGYDDTAFPPRKFLSAISKAKNDLVGPAQYKERHTDFYGSRVAEVYVAYQRQLEKLDAMDFDDLIGNYVRLLPQHDDVRGEVTDRIHHLLIDEYQDTNHSQYVLIRLLGGDRRNIVAVGDEDQSIYRFRGADVSNILNFERDFPGAKIVKLEQNYRSTGNILDAASGVVSHNVERKGKRLFTDRGAGEPVRLVLCATDREEARYVNESIHELRDAIPLTEMAVLFRTNAQSRPFEEELLASNVPYIVVGGTRFYDRAEIKDVLAWVRLAVRPHDDQALLRVINVPARGIGATTVSKLEAAAATAGTSIWTVIESDPDFLPDRARKAIGEFRTIVHDLQRESSRPVDEFLDRLLERTGYRKLYVGSRDPQDEARLENIDELVNSAREYREDNPEAGVGDYLDSVSLMADVDSWDSSRGVTLMTLHAAKGLEFRAVFLAGMEEGLMPHSNSRDDVEEERRLCYVGMTRAKERLDLIHCRQRRIHGQFHEQSPSPFLGEIPESVTAEVSRVTDYPSAKRETARRSWASDQASAESIGSFFRGAPVRFDPSAIRSPKPSGSGRSGELRRGSRVRHDLFGDGVVLQTEGSGPDAKLTVFFDRAGKKKFVAKYVKLTRI